MKLRISHVLVQPVLVWDDGEELTPGPGVEPMSLPASQVAGFVEALPAQVAEEQAKLTNS